jgi:hypothetical protein
LLSGSCFIFICPIAAVDKVISMMD